MEKKVVLPRRFSWRIICGAAFSLLIISLFLSSAKAEELITAPLDELLPSREDIPTEWYTIGSVNATLREPGFVEGRKDSYHTRLHHVSEKDLYFYVYRFTDGNSAKTYYDKQVDTIKSQGLYTAEVTIPGAFAVLYEYESAYQEEAISLGYISNIVFKVYVYNDYSGGFWVRPLDSIQQAEDHLKDFTNLQTNIIPEFPTFILLPLFMIATLLAVIVHKRKHL